MSGSTIMPMMSPETPDAIRSRLFALLNGQGAALYGGERVTQLEHALQSAAIAEASGERPAMILASLLHDVGHFFEAEFEQALSSTFDPRHEHMGSRYLSRWLDSEVTEPIRLHVEAKRYLCAVHPDYLTTLSQASIHSLAVQGGPMGAEEIAIFESRPFSSEAVRLRQYDDQAKIVGMKSPDLAHFLSLIR